MSARIRGTDISVVNAGQGQYTALGYKAAEYARQQGAYYSGSADAVMRYDRASILALARDMDQSNWLVEGLLNRATDYILGATGFSLQAKTGDPRLNTLIEDTLWPEFTDAPEVRGLLNWRDLQAVALREALLGDQLLLKRGGGDPQAGKLQHVESERIDGFTGGAVGQRVDQGVVMDGDGRPVGYRVCDVSPAGYVLSSAKIIDAANCIYLGNPFKRSSQSRCLPIFVSGLPLAHRLEDILTASTIAWQIQARLVAAIYREKNSGRTFTTDNAGTKAGRTDSEPNTLITEMGYSVIFQGKPGDKIEPISTNRPGQNFASDVETFVRLFCVPTGMPAEVLLQFWRQFNYSSARIVLLQAFLNFRRWQQHLVTRFHSRAYRWQIGRAIARGILPWRPDILDHEFNVPSWPWIDEDKEVSAWTKKIDRAIATQTQALASLGLDRQEQQDTRRKEIMDAWEAATQIEEETKGGIKAESIWRHFAGLEQGKTELAVRAGTVEPPPAAADAQETESGESNANGNA